MAKKLHKDTELQKIFIKEEGVLYRLWAEDGRTFKCILVPQVLQDFMIIPAHDYSHFDSPDLPMEFICMDLVGPIHPPSNRGNKYVLTVIDMLTGFTMAVPIKNNNAEIICEAYRDNIYCVFGGSSRILTDNGSELKKKKCRKFVKLLD